jgi:hypothetical protein
MAFIAIGLAAAALAGVVILEYRAAQIPERTLVAAPERGSAQTVSSAPAAQTAHPDWAAIILARPLFSPSRRPAPASSDTSARSAELPRLTGILVSQSGRQAIFAGRDGGRPIVTREGDRVADQLVQSIRPGEVTVLGPAGPRVLHPVFDHAPARTGAEGTPPEPGRPGKPSILDLLRNGPPPNVAVPGLAPPPAAAPAAQH